MILNKIRAGYYDHQQFSLIKEDSGWWTVYEWNAEHTESTYICSSDKLEFAKLQLKMFIELRAGA